MSLANYTDLVSEVVSLCHRAGDTEFEGKLPTWVRLFEARANRKLRVRAMEETFASVALVDGAASLPADFRAFKELRLDADPSYALLPKPVQYVKDRGVSSDSPINFAVSGSQVVTDGSGNVVGTYYQEIPSLEANSTNWLMTQNPDVYLFGVLAEAGLWVQSDQLPLWAERASQLLDSIQSEDVGNSLNGGPLTARAR